MSTAEESVTEYEVSAVPEGNTYLLTVAKKNDSTSVVESWTQNSVYGIPFPKSCNFARWAELNDVVKYKDGDILVASYPKCGTTWSEQCILLMANNANPAVLDPQSKNTYNSETKTGKIWIETMINQDPSIELIMGKEGRCIPMEEFDAIPAPRVIKTHASLSVLLGVTPSTTETITPPDLNTAIAALENLPTGCKILVVVRNPLDACVSCYYHPKNSPAKRGWPFDAFAEVYMQGYVSFGSYFDWVADWYAAAQRYPDRIIWVEFEDMKKAPRDSTERIASFLQLMPQTADDNDFLDKVVRFSSFEEMKKQIEEKEGGDHLQHMRGGRVGDWRSHFSQPMAEKMIAMTRAHLPSELAERFLQYAGV